MSTKTLEERIAESVEIRKQLERIGALLADNNKIYIESSNRYVRENISTTADLPIDDNNKVCVVFTNKSNKKSGVMLHKL